MAAISGQYGQVLIGASTLKECTHWTFNRSIVLHAYASCATSGYKKKIAGTRDGSGTIRGIFDDSDQIDDMVQEGDEVTLLLFVDKRADQMQRYSVPAIIESIDIEVDIEEGTPVRWTMNFQANGAWTEPS